MNDDPKAERAAPGNPAGSREHFRWDERHHQPHTDMSKWRKFWASRSDAAQFVRLLGRNVRAAGPVLRRYRALLAQEPARHAVAGDEFGVAVSPTRATWGRYRERLHELGAGAILIRVPSWEPGPLFDLRDEFASERRAGTGFTFTLLQNRAMVNDPAAWGAFVRESAACFAGLSPTFQVGHAVNRKKWGIWHPSEYLRLLEAAAPAREEFPGCRWIGPPVIDFEYYFTANYLGASRPFDFDGIAALLYVDRRGSPDARQYRHFDLRRKIVLLRAVVQASRHPDVAIHLTEFNWPLKGTGKHSPAGAHVQIDEAVQARYLVLYYLTAAATGLVARSFWWQLVARGYGLLDEDWAERPSYRALRHLLVRARGREVSRLADSNSGLRGFLLRRGAEVGALVYSRAKPLRPGGGLTPLRAFSLVGEELDPSALAVAAEPVYLDFGPADAEAVAAGLAGTPRR